MGLYSCLKDIFKTYFIQLAPHVFSYVHIKPSFAALNITDRCCFRCVMCSQWKETGEGELNTDEWKKVLNQLKKVGIKDVVFSGGEPLLREDIVLLAEHNKKIGLTSSIITNGYLLDEERLEKLIDSGVKNISVSLDGQGEEFDKIRGMPGAYEKVINACRLISKYKKAGKIKGYLYFTLMKNTVRNILRANPEAVKKKLEEEVKDEETRVHTAGAIAKLAYQEIKEGRDYLTIFAEYLKDLSDKSQAFEVQWPVEVLVKIKGTDFPVKSAEELKEKLTGVKVGEKEVVEILEQLDYPIENPAELLHKIREKI